MGGQISLKSGERLRIVRLLGVSTSCICRETRKNHRVFALEGREVGHGKVPRKQNRHHGNSSRIFTEVIFGRTPRKNEAVKVGQGEKNRWEKGGTKKGRKQGFFSSAKFTGTKRQNTKRKRVVAE